MTTNAPADLDLISRQIRMKLVELSHKAQTPHLGGPLSCVDILVAVYWGGLFRLDPKSHADPKRDRFIFSKGHAATALYTALTFRGFGDMATLMTYAESGSPLGEHPSPGCMPGVEAGTGSLGHGLPIGIGMALAGRLQNQPYKVCALLSDGECNEGSVWEAAMFGAAQKLENLSILVDYNKWQATGRSNEVMELDPLSKKWAAFGWESVEVDGHNIPEILNALKKSPTQNKRPLAIVAHTIKGKGISFMEDDNNWHYRSPTVEEVEKVRKELKLA